MALLKQALKKLLGLSAAALLALTLLTINPTSKSLVSEAYACDVISYNFCMDYCIYNCANLIDCPPADPYPYCDFTCKQMYGYDC
jgi:hypothetical protein